MGFFTVSEGNTIRMGPTIHLEVAEACSGLSMLVFFFALSTAIAIVIRGPWYEKVVILLSAIPIALIANITRITITGILHKIVGRELADLVFHDLAGLLMMPYALFLSWIELKLLRWVVKEIPLPSVDVEKLMRLALPERRINRKPLLILSFSTITFFTAIFFVHLMQVRGNARMILEQATRYEEEGHLDLAASCLSDYLVLEPNDVEAKVRLGIMLSNNAKSARVKFQAYSILSEVVGRNPEQNKARLELARIALLFRRHAEVRMHLDILLKKTPADASLMTLREVRRGGQSV